MPKSADGMANRAVGQFVEDLGVANGPPDRRFHSPAGGPALDSVPREGDPCMSNTQSASGAADPAWLHLSASLDLCDQTWWSRATRSIFTIVVGLIANQVEVAEPPVEVRVVRRDTRKVVLRIPVQSYATGRVLLRDVVEDLKSMHIEGFVNRWQS